MTDKDVLETIIRYIGYGKLYDRKSYDDKHKSAFALIYNGEDAVQLMNALLPHMHSRRAQKIEEIVDYYNERKVYS